MIEQPKPPPGPLLDPDGQPLEPSTPEVMEARMERWRAFEAKRGR